MAKGYHIDSCRCRSSGWRMKSRMTRSRSVCAIADWASLMVYVVEVGRAR
jgi:hypothetical protein